MTKVVPESMNPYQERAKQPKSKLAGPYGHPFHPMLVPVPIGAWVATLALDIGSRVAEDGRGYARAATLVLGVGLLGAVLAAILGFMDYAQIQDGTKAHRVAMTHMIGNLLAIGMMGGSLIARLAGNPDRVSFGLVVLTAVVLGLISFTGFLGGVMSYHYGIRVADEATQAPAFDTVGGVLPPSAGDAGRADRAGADAPAARRGAR